jgi:simple sugar transport system permease protein
VSSRLAPARFFMENAVVIIFLVVTALAVQPSGLSLRYIGQEMLIRLGRNSFLVLALLLPIYAGMGLNFGMTLGAMSGQIGLIFAINWSIMGVPGLIFAALLGTPVAVLMGWICGMILNRAKGREMVTGYMLAFFINGIYQLVVLYLMGSVIPIRSPAIVLSRGYGIRNTLNLESVRQSLDTMLMLRTGVLDVPLGTYLVIAALCVFIVWFKKTKLGQDMRAVGYDMTVAEASGIPVDRTRIVATIISTVLACYGQIIFLQNMGNVATYNAHDQTSFFAVAAILVGGASVKKATLPNVFIGVVLLHLLFVVSPRAGQNLFGSAMIGEYFRQFIGYGVIALSLVLYAWRARKEAAQKREGLRGRAQAGPRAEGAA